jgi:hypothetical protein
MEPAYKVTATFTGRLDRCRNFKLGRDWVGNGFGLMGQSEYQFILLSVSDINVRPATFGPETIPSTLPDRLPEEHHP